MCIRMITIAIGRRGDDDSFDAPALLSASEAMHSAPPVRARIPTMFSRSKHLATCSELGGVAGWAMGVWEALNDERSQMAGARRRDLQRLPHPL